MRFTMLTSIPTPRRRTRRIAPPLWLPTLLLLAFCSTHISALPIPQTQTPSATQIDPPVPAVVPGSTTSAVAGAAAKAPAASGADKPSGTTPEPGAAPSGPLQDEPPAPSLIPPAADSSQSAQPAALLNPQSTPTPTVSEAAGASPKIAFSPPAPGTNGAATDTAASTCPDPFKHTLDPLQYGRQFMGTDVHYDATGARCPSEEQADPARHFADYRGAATNTALGFDVLVSSLLAAANAIGGGGGKEVDVALVGEPVVAEPVGEGEGRALAAQLEGLLARGPGERQGVAEWFLALLSRLAARIGTGLV